VLAACSMQGDRSVPVSVAACAVSYWGAVY
jgi:hypothetical protein